MQLVFPLPSAQHWLGAKPLTPESSMRGEGLQKANGGTRATPKGTRANADKGLTSEVSDRCDAGTRDPGCNICTGCESGPEWHSFFN